MILLCSTDLIMDNVQSQSAKNVPLVAVMGFKFLIYSDSILLRNGRICVDQRNYIRRRIEDSNSATSELTRRSRMLKRSCLSCSAQTFHSYATCPSTALQVIRNVCELHGILRKRRRHIVQRRLILASSRQNRTFLRTEREILLRGSK